MEGHREVDETVRPVVHTPVKVPVALKEEVDNLVGEEIITPFTEPSRWASSLVLVNKPENLY